MKAWDRLRRRILTPDVSQTTMAVRGFHVKNPVAADRLETVGRSFLEGYAAAAEAPRPAAAEPALQEVPTAYRGFAYEGAAMALAMRDGLPGGGRRHVEQFLTGEADRHIYMVYVGVGWAMARLPRMRWNTLYAQDRLLRWLILDGYGFHQAYFRTERYVHGQPQQDLGWPVDGPAWYARRCVDQGIGRATWFVAGTDPRRVVDTFARFSEDRRADLYAGAGLAAAYAGGADEAELAWFADAAGGYRAHVAQGAAFAAAARLRAGLVVPHNELATSVLCGVSVAQASAICEESRVGLRDAAGQPAYEQWRQRIRSRLAQSGAGRGELASELKDGRA
jgi:enediyne biosynthesis protein E3